MFVLKNITFGFMRVDYGIPQLGGMKGKHRYRFSMNLEKATIFVSETRAMNAAADYGQRREQRYPHRGIPRLTLCRVEASAALRVVEEIF